MIQIVSPIVSAFNLAIRALSLAKPSIDIGSLSATRKNNKASLTLYRIIYSYVLFTIIVLTMTLIVVLCAFDYTDTRVEWAKQFKILEHVHIQNPFDNNSLKNTGKPYE